jgi:hypothetical protein
VELEAICEGERSEVLNAEVVLRSIREHQNFLHPPSQPKSDPTDLLLILT